MSSNSSASSASEEFEKTIAEDLVVTKYKMVGEIVNRVLKQVVDQCRPEASVRDLCVLGDQLLTEETGKVFKCKKDMKKGIAFPTCVSVNNCICHFSPLGGQSDCVLSDGDVVKIELGAHIDGYMALVGHTLVVGASRDKVASGRRADVVLAAHYASQAALRLLKPGVAASAVTEAVRKVAAEYDCRPVEGMLSNRLKQFVCDSERAINQNPTGEKQEEDFEFSLYDVYALDVLVSSGEGVRKETGTRESVYRKTEGTYQLKLRASRVFYSEVLKKYGNLPFNLRNFEDERTAKLAINECVNHGLIEPFKVVYERQGEFVAQFKATVLIMPSGPHKITGLPFDAGLYLSEFAVTDPQLKSLLNTSANPRTMRKKKRRANKPGVQAIGVGTD